MSKNNSTVLKFANLEDFSKLLAIENVRLCRDTGDGSGVEGAADTILMHFLKHYVAALIADSLKKHEGNKSISKDQLIQKTERSLNVAKNLIQDGVADGMALAMSRWARRDVQYFCVVRQEPAPTNKTFN